MSLLSKTLNIDFKEEIDDQDLYQLILHRVRELLDQDPNLLFSYLYRLDVLEEKINFVLKVQKHVPTDEGLAQLILERQKQRIALKKKFKQDPIDDWES